MADMHTYEFSVSMSCGGCSSAIERVLKRLDGVEKYEVSLDRQSATVVTGLPFDTVYTKIAKTGKTINSAKVDGEPKAIAAA